ncbi:MAG: carboxynorspermidine decarboxylase [Desulfobacterales bacterium]
MKPDTTYTLDTVPTPCYVLDEAALEKNLKILAGVQDRTGCRILLALKGFALFGVFETIRRYLFGVSTSSLHEARLGFEAFGKEVHVCAPAYREAEFPELLTYADHIVFNSFSQWRRFKPRISEKPGIRCGIRVNPEHSEVKVPIYDPCGPGSRLGVTRERFRPQELDGISGLHFHTLCELNADSLDRTLAAFEEKFGAFLPQMDWVNFGGGHHITRHDYDLERLCRIVEDFRKRRGGMTVYLEPGEAIALNAGVLVASVLDIVANDMEIAIIDASAAAHMPDVLEMPYRPEAVGAGAPGELSHTYRLGGTTCLAGDVVGEYSFPEPLQAGSRIVFTDMAHYTMVKNNTFNGVGLPSIGIQNRSGKIRILRRFGYEDYRNRLS